MDQSPADDDALGFVMLGMTRNDEWTPIQLAPEGCDLELGEEQKTGVVPWPFPCRRQSGVWIDVAHDEPVLIYPTHCRPWITERRPRLASTGH